MSRRPSRLLAVLAISVLLSGACATSEQRRRQEQPVPEARPTAVQRTGVPFLMDLPIIGVFFRHTTVVR